MEITYETTEEIAKGFPGLAKIMKQNGIHGAGIVKSGETSFEYEIMNNGTFIFTRGSKSLFDRAKKEGFI